MFSGKPHVFEAVTVHSDDIEQLPPDALVLASNDMGIQAVELHAGAASIWAVQYHPEYSYAEIAATTLRYADALIDQELFSSRVELEQFVTELRQLMQDPQNRGLAWKHGLGPAMQNERLKLAELRNWLELKVMPRHRRRH
jgi:GMP synthase (glutamine-hydrolysing)